MKVKERMRTSVARVLPAATVGEVLCKMDGSGVTSLPVEDAALDKKPLVEPRVFFQISSGVYIISSKKGAKYNGMIASSPFRSHQTLRKW